LVHDDNARAMGGVAPHAGLFGSAWEVAKVARRWLVGEVPGADGALRTRGRGSHVLGWDTPSGEQSSAGASPPADAVGHTGFTGTSVWMSHSRDFIAVLLTNRVAYGRDPSRIRALRHAWHQVAWGAVSSAARRSTPP
jgi:CubicO group peptidase (beta-lactamase class C family)